MNYNQDNYRYMKTCLTSNSIMILFVLFFTMGCVHSGSVVPTDKRLQNSAREAYEEGRYQIALEDLNRAISIDPEYRLYYMDRSKVYRKLGMLKEADRDFQYSQKLKAKLDKLNNLNNSIESSKSSESTAFNKAKTEIKQSEELEKNWLEWQAKMGQYFTKLVADDASSNFSNNDRKSQWETFLNNYILDNPYSDKDNSMRRTAIKKISYWAKQENITVPPQNLKRPVNYSNIPSTVANRYRMALVIGNNQYQYISPLNNPVNDAKIISKALRYCGFDVEVILNAGRREMAEGIHRFHEKLIKYKSNVALFFYAGHGLQQDGINYLIPVDAQIKKKFDIELECYKANAILNAMEESNSELNIVFLDACRNNPFRGFRSASRGLALMDAPVGSILVYSTAPGKVAEDGEGENSLFTSMLVKHMMTPGLTLEQVLKQVRYDVVKGTNGDQVPWESSSLIGNFYFNRSDGLNSAVPNLQ